MIDQIVVPSIIAGIGTTIFTEIIKFIPWFRKTDFRKAFLAFIVCLGISWWYVFTNPQLHYDIVLMFFLTLLWSYLSYKTILQPLAAKVNISTQENV